MLCKFWPLKSTKPCDIVWYKTPSEVGRSFAWWFTSNTKAYWLVLFMSDKPHILRLSLLVKMEFVIPFTAPPIPISICLGWIWYWAGRRGGGGCPFVLWMFSTVMRSSCSCWIKLFYFGYSRRLFENAYIFLEKNNPETRELQVSFIDWCFWYFITAWCKQDQEINDTNQKKKLP